jgi:hypothetical protein
VLCSATNPCEVRCPPQAPLMSSCVNGAIACGAC